MQYFNISADVLGLIVCIIIIFCCIINTKIQKKNSLYHMFVFITLALYVASNLVGLLYKGNPHYYANIILKISNFCEFFFGIVLSFVFTLYLCFYFNIILNKKRKIIIFTMYLPAVILLIISQFNHMYYYIDDANIYHRGSLFLISQLIGVFYQLMNFLIFVLNVKKLNTLEKVAFLVYFILPVIGLIIQTRIYGIYWFLLADVIAAIIMFVIMLYVQVLKYLQIEKESQEAQINVMLSQIQPHFLYNTLSSIIGICDDPQMTKKTITNFAKYLRVNLDSLKRQNPIPVLQELEHVKNYVDLEKLRFGDRLNVTYNINCSNFKIPPLTIQLMVENSIKHGITPKESGGLVDVSTNEDEYFYYIIVADDGIGFEQDKSESGKSHVGLNNLRARLQSFVNGSLDIESKINEGTVVTIKIPKGDN